MTTEKPSLVGDPDDPLAYLREFVEGEASHNPDKLARAYLILAEQNSGLEQQVYQALAWAVGATRTESRVSNRIRALEERVQALETRLGGSGGGA